ncbi:unnamed protein product, partial [marine sediment metagenome]
TPASVRGQFEQPENILGRVQGQAENARATWLSLHDQKDEPQLSQVMMLYPIQGCNRNVRAWL